MAQLIVNANVDSMIGREADTFDVPANAYQEFFPVIRSGDGNLNDDDDDPAQINICLVGGFNGGKFSFLQRALVIFDTSALPDNATITSATFSFYIDSLFNQMSGNGSVNSKLVLVAISPRSNTNAVANYADFKTFGTVDFGRSAIQSSLTTFQFNTITLNDAGLAYISKTGYTRFGLMLGWDFDNTVVGLTVAQDFGQGIGISTIEEDSVPCKLTINYTTPAAYTPASFPATPYTSEARAVPAQTKAARPATVQTKVARPSTTHTREPLP